MNFPICRVLGAMLSRLREHKNPRHNPMLTKSREHGTRGIGFRPDPEIARMRILLSIFVVG